MARFAEVNRRFNRRNYVGHAEEFRAVVTDFQQTAIAINFEDEYILGDGGAIGMHLDRLNGDVSIGKSLYNFKSYVHL